MTDQLSQKADQLSQMYNAGVLVENNIDASKYFRQRMGYQNPDTQATALVDVTQNGSQAKWRGQTFDKRELIAGVNNGEMPGSDTNTDVLQARAMNPWSAPATNRMDYLNPSWQANVSQFGGNMGTIEMLASGHAQPLPMAMDHLEQISANALDEDKRSKANDPLSNTYAMVHLGVEELLAQDRAARLANVRGRDSSRQDITIDTGNEDRRNSYNTSYQGPSIKQLTSYLSNPVYEKTRKDRIRIGSKNFKDNIAVFVKPPQVPISNNATPIASRNMTPGTTYQNQVYAVKRSLAGKKTPIKSAISSAATNRSKFSMASMSSSRATDPVTPAPRRRLFGKSEVLSREYVIYRPPPRRQMVIEPRIERDVLSSGRTVTPGQTETNNDDDLVYFR